MPPPLLHRAAIKMCPSNGIHLVSDTHRNNNKNTQTHHFMVISEEQTKAFHILFDIVLLYLPMDIPS